jgi:hypothetical protein
MLVKIWHPLLILMDTVKLLMEFKRELKIKKQLWIKCSNLLDNKKVLVWKRSNNCTIKEKTSWDSCLDLILKYRHKRKIVNVDVQNKYKKNYNIPNKNYKKIFTILKIKLMVFPKL